MSILRRTKVLIVDDSALVRRIVSTALSRDPEIEVVGGAADPYEARELIVATSPDVITLDLEMPKMDGLTFLRILMQHHPLPVIVMSSLTQAGSGFALDALEAGAVEVLGKPNGSQSVGSLAEELPNKIKAAARSRRRQAGQVNMLTGDGGQFHPRQIILLGASTGGTEALKEVLQPLPREMPGICVVQHIPAHFCGAFAARLNTLCRMEVRIAEEGDRVQPGLVLIAPGDYHMLLRLRDGQYTVHLNQGPKVWYQRPAVDLLFRSAAEHVGSHAIAGVLTGMGVDGADGLLKLRQGGARTFVQDEATCVVYGMPRAAYEAGAAEIQLPLDRVPSHLVELSRRQSTARRAVAGAGSA